MGVLRGSKRSRRIPGDPEDHGSPGSLRGPGGSGTGSYFSTMPGPGGPGCPRGPRGLGGLATGSYFSTTPLLNVWH